MSLKQTELIIINPSLELIHSNESEHHKLWVEIYSKQKICISIPPLLNLDAPIEPDKVRFVCISDTHDKLNEILTEIPNGDVLLHCGDFTNFGELDEIQRFNEQIGRLPHTHKIVIAGNHELGFEDLEDLSLRGEKYAGRGTSKGYKYLTNCTYLHDTFVEIYGLKIYGSSWHPLPGYSFSRQRGSELMKQWLKIPKDVDVLMTHTPPLGYMDIFHDQHDGCADLLKCVEERIQPKFHIYGHMHEQNGLTTNKQTIFINSAICDHNLNVVYKPILFDLPLPVGHKK